MIKASALLYAVFICFIISIFTGGLIYIYSLNKQLSMRLGIQEELIHHCESCLNYFLSNNNNNTSETNIDLFDDGIKCNYQLKKWGLLNVLSISSHFKKDTLSTAYIIGNKYKETDSYALYMCDLGEGLKVSGTTSITGNMWLPKKKYEITNILGNQQINNPVLNGQIYTAQQNLPEIIPILIGTNTIDENDFISIDDINKSEINYNSFTKKTIHIYVDDNTTINNINLKGNFILHSHGKINISQTAFLEDVIIKANEVFLATNFEGNLQVFAKKGIITDKNVTLNYPSCIYLNTENNSIDDTIIEINEGSKIFGAVVLNTSNNDSKSKSSVFIDKKCSIIGDVYSNNLLEIKGDVYGTVHCFKLEYNTDYSSYTDLLINANIDYSKLPEDFIRIPFLDKSVENKIKYGIIKQL